MYVLHPERGTRNVTVHTFSVSICRPSLRELLRLEQ